MKKVILASALLISGSLNGYTQQKSAESLSRTFNFTSSVRVKDISQNAKSLQIFIPIPKESPHQTVLSYYMSVPYKVLTDSIYDNKIAYINLSENIPENLEIKINYLVKRFENIALYNSAVSTEEPLSRFLLADSLVPIDDIIADEASSVVNDNMTDLEKASELYQHLFQTMKYDKSGTGWGRGDALYACDVRAGNCTDIHSAFIGMIRSQGIPARFIMGFPLPSDKTKSDIGGYHCWAEFYINDKGWIPVDISEAIRHPEKKDYLFGNLDYDRISISIGRDITIKTSEGKMTLNYLIYPLVLVDGQLYDNFDKKFEFEDVR